MDVPLCNVVLTKIFQAQLIQVAAEKRGLLNTYIRRRRATAVQGPSASGRHTIPVFIAAVETGARVKAELLKLKLQRKGNEPDERLLQPGNL